MKKCIVAGAVIFGKDYKVLLIKHKKLGVWLYPGGHLEENENPIQCAIREAKEETGIDIKILDIRKEAQKFEYAQILPMPIAILLENVNYKEGAHEHFDLVYASEAESDSISLNEKETEGIRWFTEDEIDSLKTYQNVKYVLKQAFNAYKQFKIRQ
ncbi:MAG: NUDIX hydrolase [Candidatus Micrarchaeia archaeon]